MRGVEKPFSLGRRVGMRGKLERLLTRLSEANAAEGRVNRRSTISIVIDNPKTPVIPAKAGIQPPVIHFNDGLGWKHAFTPRRNDGGSSGLRRNSEGFSLLEILVAFTILALAVGILMQIFSRGVNGATLADRYARATMYAESKLATVGIEEALKETVLNGKFDDDFSWDMAVRVYQDPIPKEPSVIDFEKLMPTQLYEIELNVKFTADDQRERVVKLSTLRLGPKA